MSKKVVLAELLQKDVDVLLKQELAQCDSHSKKLGDAFLIQIIDSVHNIMSTRRGFEKHAAKVDGVAAYFAQIYPPEFVQGLTADNTGTSKLKKPSAPSKKK